MLNPILVGTRCTELNIVAQNAVHLIWPQSRGYGNVDFRMHPPCPRTLKSKVHHQSQRLPSKHGLFVDTGGSMKNSVNTMQIGKKTCIFVICENHMFSMMPSFGNWIFQCSSSILKAEYQRLKKISGIVSTTLHCKYENCLWMCVCVLVWRNSSWTSTRNIDSKPLAILAKKSLVHQRGSKAKQVEIWKEGGDGKKAALKRNDWAECRGSGP